MSPVFWSSLLIVVGLVLIVLEIFLPSGGLIGFLLGLGASIGIVTLINAISAGQKWTHQISFVAALVFQRFLLHRDIDRAQNGRVG